MFWRKKPKPLKPNVEFIQPPRILHSQDQLSEASSKLAHSLKNYSDAVSKALQKDPDEELKAAKAKVETARKLMRDSRLSYALGTCIPEHIEHWHAWSKREDFYKWVRFDAENIEASQEKIKDGSRDVTALTVRFSYHGKNYGLRLRDKGHSYAPDSTDKLGEIELWDGDQLVAHCEISKDYGQEYSTWKFSDVRALRVGTWMQDVLAIAAQIDAGQRKWSEDFFEERTRSAAANIDLG